MLPCVLTLPGMGTLLVRTDFGDDEAWDRVRDEATREYGPDGFRACVEPVKAAAPVDDSGPSVLFVADRVRFGSGEDPILVVDLDDKTLSVAEFPEIAGRAPFRCVPSELWGVENNLNISNMDWEDFASAVGGDGVFRGFGLPPPTPDGAAEADRRTRLPVARCRFCPSWVK